jgi:hypothetical protein
LFAKSVKPPAIAIAWMIDICPCTSGRAPGLLTSPVTKTTCGDVSVTMTVTTGFAMYSSSAPTMASRSSTDVRPEAAMSPTSGSVILPSGRIWSDCDSCVSL